MADIYRDWEYFGNEEGVGFLKPRRKKRRFEEYKDEPVEYIMNDYEEDAGLTLRKSSTTLTNASFRVYLFNSNPGTFTVGDNAAFNLSGALGIPTVSGLIGYFDVVMTQSGTAGAVGFGASNTGNPLVGKPSTGTSMYFVIEASAAYTPASAETFTVELGGQWS